MNGLVLANELRWFSFFWECTTLCSFFLIGHDGTEIARANAKRALFLNLLGGIALSGGSLWAAADGGATTLQGLMATKAAVPALLLCMAALVKSAQMPFQSWLLGAMVAPTPVSALLHSATMVKAGSYLLLRLSPAFAGEPFMRWLALGGALTFTLTAALAIGQSNAKRVLAYSTISNLGLIVVCAALGTPMAYAAGLTLLIFHAVSKGLLFLCVGTIEQGIGSRDIEDMGDLVNRMPYTTLFASVGMISMLLPPFGMLLSKWIVVEASIVSPPIMALTVLGSALSVVFWAKWIGRIQTTSTTEHHGGEHLPRTVVAANGLLALAVFGGGLAAVPLLQHCFVPLTEELFSEAPVSPEAWGRLAALGDFELWPLLVCLGGALAAWLLVRRRFSVAQVRAPFLCGENVDSEDPDVTYAFRSVGDLPQEAWSRTLYFRGVFDEGRLSFWGNLAAAMILFILAGLTGLI
jgi:ech hydrogenase subunit A